MNAAEFWNSQEQAQKTISRFKGLKAQTGGLGQTIEFSVDTLRNWELNAVTSRLSESPQGLFGGQPGAAGSFKINDEQVTTQSRITLSPSDVVCLELPGGGGYGKA